MLGLLRISVTSAARQLVKAIAVRGTKGVGNVRDPKAFLMDEPLSNLDAQLRQEMRQEIRNLQRELGNDLGPAVTEGHIVAWARRAEQRGHSGHGHPQLRCKARRQTIEILGLRNSARILAELAGAIESPVYALSALAGKLDALVKVHGSGRSAARSVS